MKKIIFKGREGDNVGTDSGIFIFLFEVFSKPCLTDIFSHYEIGSNLIVSTLFKLISEFNEENGYLPRCDSQEHYLYLVKASLIRFN